MPGGTANRLNVLDLVRRNVGHNPNMETTTVFVLFCFFFSALRNYVSKSPISQKNLSTNAISNTKVKQ